MVNLQNYLDTRQWNIVRGYAFKFNATLENDMLEEEKKEFFDAYEKYKTLKADPLALDERVDLAVDMIDAICDYVFVAAGLDTKTQLCTLSMDEQQQVSILKGNADRMLGSMGAILTDTVGAKVDLNVCYAFVVEANNLKPAKTNNEGKGIKGDEWVDPKYNIKSYVESLGIREYI